MSGAGATREHLCELISIAETNFGYFDEYPPYRYLYPWVISCFANLNPGAGILDAGAGVSPLPLFWDRRGIYVDTVDASPEQVRLPLDGNATAWGFLDYGELFPHLRSFNVAIEDYHADRTYDGIYSVGMIAHLPAKVRRNVLPEFRRILKPRSILAIHVDLVRGTDAIWRHYRDREIEPAMCHGDARALFDELTQNGFAIRSHQIVRTGDPGLRTDNLMIEVTAV